MKQVLQNLRSGETYVADVPVPSPQPGMALVRTCASLVSAGTERTLVEFAGKSLVGKARARPDLVRQVFDKARREGLLTTIEAAFNRLDQPMPLGYSSAGIIEALGEGLQGYRVGDRVACAGGGYAVHAEFAIVPQNLMVPLPESVDFESAAFATLGAIAMHGYRLADAGLGARVGVIGLGLLGLLSVGIATAAGCHVLGVDLDPQRVELGAQLGAQTTRRDGAEEAAQAFSRGRGCDAVLICADTLSSDPVQLAGEIARDRARVVAVGAVGMDIPRKRYYEKELEFVVSRSYGPGRYDPDYEEGGRDYPVGYVRWTEGRNLEAFIDLLAGGQLDIRPLISHRFSVEAAPRAYELITGKTAQPFLGVLLTYSEPDGLTSARDRWTVDMGTRGDSRTQAVERITLGVLGAGNFAMATLLPALKGLAGVELVGVASASGLSARNAARRFGFRYATSDPKEIIDDPRVNTVAVLTRHHLHAPLSLAALSAGKHVFCEKPLALTAESLDALAEALINLTMSNDQPPILMVGFNRRFAPLSRQLARFLSGRREPLVAHYRINAGYLPPDHWAHDPEQGGGRLVGEGCHFVDFLTYLAGAPPLAVTAHGLPGTGRYQEDNAVITLSFPDGSLGTLTYVANGDRSFPKERVEVFTGGRVAVLDDFRSLVTVAQGRRRSVRSRLRQDKGHRAEMQAFARAILGGEPPPIPYDQLIGVTRATFAVVQSLRIGGSITLQVPGF